MAASLRNLSRFRKFVFDPVKGIGYYIDNYPPGDATTNSTTSKKKAAELVAPIPTPSPPQLTRPITEFVKDAPPPSKSNLHGFHSISTSKTTTNIQIFNHHHQNKNKNHPLKLSIPNNWNPNLTMDHHFYSHSNWIKSNLLPLKSDWKSITPN